MDGQGAVVDSNEVDRTENFLRGARAVVRIVELVRPDLIILKEGSPSCGLRRVDIEGRKVSGLGVTAAMLRQTGILLISEEDPLPKP